MTSMVTLLVGHGSRRAEAIAQFNRFVVDFAALSGQPAHSCFLELAEPDMASGLERAAQEAGAGGTVVVLPIFLGAANHEKNDVATAIQWARQRFSEVAFRYATPLGPHAKLVDLLDLRLREAHQRAFGALPLEESSVLVVGRGSSDPDSNSELARTAHLLFEQRPYRFVTYAFQAVARPTIEEALHYCHAAGARQVLVAPYILFTGRVYEDILTVSSQVAARRGLRIIHATYLAPHPLLLEVAQQRWQEALESSAAMTCDICKYRFPMAGYEAQVGQPQYTHHLHGSHAHHEHTHSPEGSEHVHTEASWAP
ncbi:MAG: sirohydrochlorin chelatase [Anaerolineae bacterium]|nr:sirohydrochlorin chelatase [Anaerolineae bacterium]MDW8070922.1 sirohydrochlorin chelatase [Anaerolineae bacterium]